MEYERLGQEDESLPLKPSHRRSRPPVYYEDGPFNPPSSDSEEDESLLEKPLTPSVAERGAPTAFQMKQRPSSVRFLLFTLAGLVSLSIAIGIFAGHSYVGKIFRVAGVQRITMDHIFNGTFAVERRSLSWVPEAGDGVFSIEEDGYIRLVNIRTNTTTDLVAVENVQDEQGNRIPIQAWQLSSDMEYLLVKTDYRRQWRHSSFGNFYIHTLATRDTRPLIPPEHPARTSYATWSPTGSSIAFVHDNDLYVLPSPSSEPVRITNTGSTTVFNGVPDWVYEEEVFSSDYTLWWSPNSTKIAFCSFNETEVEEFVFPIYNPTEDATTVNPYTEEVRMRYPKPGYRNPDVKLYVYEVGEEQSPGDVVELNWEGRHGDEDSIVSEVTWVGDTTLVIKETNRNADDGSVILFDFTQGRQSGTVTRTLGANGEEGDDGWIDHSQNIHPLDSHEGGYLDIVPSPEGYAHIALFSPANASTPQFLTSGAWEVDGGIKGVDSRGTVYFMAANPSIGRHLYSVSLDDETKELKALTDESEPDSYYTTDFSPQAGFYLVSYEGPGIPWQRVLDVEDPDFNYELTDNERLWNVTQQFEEPIVIYSTIESDGYEFNVKEVRPPRMDDSGKIKYPVLFRVYGGPNSQTVDLRFTRDWHDYVACGLQYIVVTVDGRGTGFKGRRLRNVVKGNLGFFETIDQINAARIWAAKPYVDRKRIGIWGWSYGGFMSSKVAEADAGIHSLAMAVAPVTSWLLYDSIYTERYMNLPDVNPGGYVNASISNVTGFHHIDYLLAHGSGDDNVHYANSAHLLDMLTAAQVRGFRFRMFTDSDHGIRRRGALRELYEFLTEFLEEKWGKGGRRRGW